MATDLKLNVWQKTQGEIKRMIKKAGGVDKLRKELGEMDVD
jgi:nucleolar protein 16